MKKKQTHSPVHSDQIIDIIRQKNRPLRLDDLLRLAGIPRQEKKDLEDILKSLEAAGKIVRLQGGCWAAPGQLNFIEGEFRALPGGGGLVISEDREIAIPAKQSGGALHTDKVRAAITPRSDKGKVVKILERGFKEIIVLAEKRQGRILHCRPLNRFLPFAVNLFMKPASREDRKARQGMLLGVELVRESSPGIWTARLEKIYGSFDDARVQEAVVKRAHEVPSDFSHLALAQADACGVAPDEADIEAREDARNIPFVTIDGADARDFDDAIHVEETPDGWILRVAIADVSHYVRPDARRGSLDSEAARRGNSWYFPTSVEPMLPEALSNGLCSLRPGEDRLAMMAEMRFSKDGKTGPVRFAPVVIRSAARLTYPQAAEYFNTRSFPAHIDERVAPMLDQAFALYQILAQKRRERGSLDFELPEPAYEFNENGQLIAMKNAERTDANMLIEEFMIAANEAVAEYLQSKKIPFLYRVHPEPEPMKLESLYETLKAVAPELLPPNAAPGGNLSPSAIQPILKAAKGSSEEYVVDRLCLRSMSQARYQPENVGHFGLASRAYCHFTSPIRRYADLLTHRALKADLGITGQTTPDAEKLSEIGESLNGLERSALDCEREMAKRLACLAVRGHEGKKMKGVISGVTDFGIFVEFDEMPADGLIRLQELGGDWYELDKARQCLVGQRTGKIWRLGEPVSTKIKEIDLDRMEIRLSLADSEARTLPATKGSKAGRAKKISGGKNFSGKDGALRGKKRRNTEKRADKRLP